VDLCPLVTDLVLDERSDPFASSGPCVVAPVELEELVGLVRHGNGLEVAEQRIQLIRRAHERTRHHLDRVEVEPAPVCELVEIRAEENDRTPEQEVVDGDRGKIGDQDITQAEVRIEIRLLGHDDRGRLVQAGDRRVVVGLEDERSALRGDDRTHLSDDRRPTRQR